MAAETTGQGEHTDTGLADDSGSSPEVIHEYRSTGLTLATIGLFLLAILLIVILAQNTAGVPFDFLWLSAEPPLFVVLLVTAAVSFAVTEGLGSIWRRRRRRQRTEREELERLRSGRSA